MTSGEKLMHIINKTVGGNQAEFSRKTGIPAPVLTRIKNGIMPLSKIRIDAIKKAFPDVSEVFLYPEGEYTEDWTEVSIRAKYEAQLAKKDELIESLLKQIELNRKVIERLLEQEERRPD